MLKWIDNSFRGVVIAVVFGPLMVLTAHANTLSVSFDGAPTTNPTLTIQDSVAGFGPVTYRPI